MRDREEAQSGEEGARRPGETGEPERVFMTPGEVSAMLRVDANTVARWANDGRITAVRTPGGHRRYLASEVYALARGLFRVEDREPPDPFAEADMDGG